MPEAAPTLTRTEVPRAEPRPAAIASIAMALPANLVGNEAIAERLGIEPEWILERTGVRERRVLGPEESLVELGAEAAARGLAQAGVPPGCVDLVLVATMSHERLTPALAPLIAARIGTAHAGALDLNAACTGFVGALAMAAGQVESGRAERVLVVAAERLSALTDHDDRATAALFGDGAGAAVVGPASGAGFGPFVLGSDGDHAGVVTAERDDPLIRMQGQDTFRHAVNRMSQATLAAAEAAAISLAEIDLFAYHQANVRILRAVGQRLGLDPERVAECIELYGNTSAATIPIALATAQAEGRLQPGHRVLLAAFGGGLTWGATVVEWEGGLS